MFVCGPCDLNLILDSTITTGMLAAMAQMSMKEKYKI
jgi:hypothetical protein